MRYKFFSNYFFITWLAVSCAAGLVWLENFRGYEGELSVLVIEKTETVQAAENLSELAKNLSFYEAVILKNELLDDRLVGLAPDRRKAAWQDLVAVRQEKESGLLRVTAWGKSPEEARLLADTTARVLFDTAARYYNVKTDLDLRIVDGPFVQTAVRSLPYFFGLSIATGFVVALVFFGMLAGVDRLLARTILRRPDQPSLPPETFRPMPPEYWPFEDRGEKREAAAPQAASVLSPSGKAVAPANLPVLEDQPLSPLQGAMARLIKEDIDAATRDQAIDPEKSATENIPRTEEPSSEEYKRRLNALLSGKME